MVHAKNYETMSTNVKVMQKKLRPLFSGHGACIYVSWSCFPVTSNCSCGHEYNGSVAFWTTLHMLLMTLTNDRYIDILLY